MVDVLAGHHDHCELSCRGYAIAGRIDAAAVAQLERLYDSLGCDLNEGFHADMFSRNFDYRRAVLNGIRGLLASHVEPLFTNHRICVANFIVKEADSITSEVGIHQDWTVVAPPFRSYNIFVPLCDVNVDNGCLHVVPGSHRSERISSAPWNPLPAGDVLGEIHSQYLQPMPMQAGQLLVYDGALLHYSPPNRSPRRRIAIGVIMIPRTVDLRLYYQPPNSTPEEVHVYAVDDAFFIEFDLQASGPPKHATYLETKRIDRTPITTEELRSWAKAS